MNPPDVFTQLKHVKIDEKGRKVPAVGTLDEQFLPFYESLVELNFLRTFEEMEIPLSFKVTKSLNWIKFFDDVKKMEKGLAYLESNLPGKPFLYSTTKDFSMELEKFLRNFYGKDYFPAVMYMYMIYDTTEPSRVVRRVEKHVPYFRILLHQRFVCMHSKLGMEMEKRLKDSEGYDYEEYLFQLSRNDCYFTKLAHLRQEVLAKMRSAANCEDSAQGGVLVFSDEDEFGGFVATISNRILSCLPELQPSGVIVNILRTYTGEVSKSKLFRGAILVKILREEIFEKYRVRIGQVENHLKVGLTQREALVIGRDLGPCLPKFHYTRERGYLGVKMTQVSVTSSERMFLDFDSTQNSVRPDLLSDIDEIQSMSEIGLVLNSLAKEKSKDGPFIMGNPDGRDVLKVLEEIRKSYNFSTDTFDNTSHLEMIQCTPGLGGQEDVREQLHGLHLDASLK